MSTTELTQDQVRQTYHYLLTYFAQTGQPPSSQALEQDLHLSKERADEASNLIEAQGSIYRDPTTREILAAYPFSARSTDHLVRFPDGHWVYSMCAIDALRMPAMLDIDAEIESRCAHCGDRIHVVVENHALAEYSPTTARLWYMQPDNCCVPALEQCPSINFFCSAEHLAAWRAQHPTAQGNDLVMEDAFRSGVKEFGNVLKREGTKNGEPL
jgi:hypothetical protein